MKHLVPIRIPARLADRARTMFILFLFIAAGCGSPDQSALRANRAERTELAGQRTASLDSLASGAVKAGAGDWDGAIADFTQAIALNPRNVRAYACRGYAKEKEGDWAGAVADCSRAIDVVQELETRLSAIHYVRPIPRNLEYEAFPFQIRGEAERAKGDLAGAKADYTKVLELKPDLAVAYENPDQPVAVKGALDRAFLDYTKVVKPVARNPVGTPPVDAYPQALFPELSGEPSQKIMITAGQGPVVTVFRNYLAAAGRRDASASKTFLAANCRADLETECEANAGSGWLYSERNSWLEGQQISADGKYATLKAQIVFAGGGTYMASEKTFFFVLEGADWKLAAMNPKPNNAGPGVRPL